MQLVLNTSGIKLSKKDDTFLIESEKHRRVVSPQKIKSIAITANIKIDSSVILLAVKHQVPILFFNPLGKVQARLWSPYFEGLSTLRRQQIRFTESTHAAAWMSDIFILKTEGQIKNLRYLTGHKFGFGTNLSNAIKTLKQQNRNFEKFRNQLPENCQKNMMGTEGNIARVYWQAFGNALPRRFSFQKRSRRPAEDFFNAMLNYAYGMLYGVVESAIFAAGLDPYLGILHSDEYKKPTLAFDLIEPFRPWIDHLLAEQALLNTIQNNHFSHNQHGITLNKHGKAFLIPLFNDFMRSPKKWLDKEVTVQNHIYHLAGQLSQRIRSV